MVNFIKYLSVLTIGVYFFFISYDNRTFNNTVDINRTVVKCFLIMFKKIRMLCGMDRRIAEAEAIWTFTTNRGQNTKITTHPLSKSVLISFNFWLIPLY